MGAGELDVSSAPPNQATSLASMDWLFVAVGTALVIIGGYDVFHTLLNPSGRGTISRLVFAAGWRSSRRARRLGVAVGPASVVATIATWAALQVVGWALIYLPSFPEGFAYTNDLDPTELVPLVEAVYFSGATLTTLGFGDAVPADAWLRVLAPVEALTGFALLSASATWFLQLHGALARRRTLALRLSQLEESGFAASLTITPHPSAAVVIESLAAQIAGARVDFVQSAETYYFRELDQRASLSTALQTAWTLAVSAEQSPDASVQQAGKVLDSALRDLADNLHESFLARRRSTAGSIPDVLELYSDDHRRR